MQHRHLNHHDFTLAAIDDTIARGRLPDWDRLRLAVQRQPEIQAKVLRICEAHIADPYAQRYFFWKRYAEAQRAAA